MNIGYHLDVTASEVGVPDIFTRFVDTFFSPDERYQKFLRSLTPNNNYGADVNIFSCSCS